MNSCESRAFAEEHGLQCGFCTPGFIVSIASFLEEVPGLDDRQLRERLSGNICRCTGYMGIVRAARRAAAIRGQTRSGRSAGAPGGSRTRD
jgi:carbon-monoxide dehydrogenase small subunit